MIKRYNGSNISKFKKRNAKATFLIFVVILFIVLGIAMYMTHGDIKQFGINIWDSISDSVIYIRGLLGWIILFGVIAIIGGRIETRRRANEKKIDTLVATSLEMSPEQFFQLRNIRLKSVSVNTDYAGVYILCNQSKNMYYVGQSVHVMDRVNQHFTGHGNGDVYADYKYGDIFSIRIVKLAGSGFDSLNSLERSTIARYGAYYRGYNKTRGNNG